MYTPMMAGRAYYKWSRVLSRDGRPTLALRKDAAGASCIGEKSTDGREAIRRRRQRLVNDYPTAVYGAMPIV